MNKRIDWLKVTAIIYVWDGTMGRSCGLMHSKERENHLGQDDHAPRKEHSRLVIDNSALYLSSVYVERKQPSRHHQRVDHRIAAPPHVDQTSRWTGDGIYTGQPFFLLILQPGTWRDLFLGMLTSTVLAPWLCTRIPSGPEQGSNLQLDCATAVSKNLKLTWIQTRPSIPNIPNRWQSAISVNT